MPNQKSDELFAIAPLPALTELSSRQEQSLVNRDLTPRQKRVAAELQIQQLVMDGQRRKALRGQDYIQELHIHAVELFNEGTDTMWALRAGERDQVAQQLIDQFTIRQIQRNGIYLEHAVDAGAGGILQEMQRSLYPERRMQRPGFWARLGGAEESYED